MDEIVVFLMREFGWSLEYTTNLVKTLETGRLNALLKELEYQRKTDAYESASNFAMVLATWASSQGKKRYGAQDFIGRAPQRSGIAPGENLYDAATREGIRMPKEVRDAR